MKKTAKLFCMLATTMVIALSVSLLASCEKEPEPPSSPEEPEQPEVFVPLHCEGTLICDGDTFYCHGAEILDESFLERDSTLVLNISLGGSRTLYVHFTEVDEDSITYPILSYSAFDRDGGCYADYYNPIDDIIYIEQLQSGSITIIKLGNSRYRIYGSGKPFNHNHMEFSFEGGIYDRDYPTGKGAMTIGDIEQDLNYAKHYHPALFHNYVITGYRNENIIYIYTRDELTKDIPFTSNIEDLSSLKKEFYTLFVISLLDVTVTKSSDRCWRY